MTAFYNEKDAFCAQWLRNLIAAGHIAPGVVDERDIKDIHPHELLQYTQCHFFAGIGVWAYALRRAGWPDNRRVWTGSCPCQPYSAAGRKQGFADERHLWPHWYWLIDQLQPDVIFGEQVASADGLDWLDLVFADLQASGYACGPIDTCAAGVGAPHIRQRLYFVADATGGGQRELRSAQGAWAGQFDGGYSIGGLVNAGGARCQGRALAGVHREEPGEGARDAELAGRCEAGQLAYADGNRSQGIGELAARIKTAAGKPAWGALAGGGRAQFSRLANPHDFSPVETGHQPIGQLGLYAPGGRGVGVAGYDQRAAQSVTVEPVPGPLNGPWQDADWLLCRDGRWRPVEPGTFPLADGLASRVGRLRAYGNALCAENAIEAIEAYIHIRGLDLAW